MKEVVVGLSKPVILYDIHSKAERSSASVTLETEMGAKEAADETQITHRKQIVDCEFNNMSSFSHRVHSAGLEFVVRPWPAVLRIPEDLCLSCSLLPFQ
jgi:hypothetical protein